MWQIDGEQAGWQSGTFTASLDLNKPGNGLGDIRMDGSALPIDRIAGVDWSASILVDHYVRGDDLVARYERSTDRTLSYEIYWRLLSSDTPGSAGIDVIVSAQTSALEADPTVTLVSALSAEQVLMPQDELGADFQVTPLEAIQQNRGFPKPLIFHLPNAPVSYAEMVYPGDCVETCVAANSPQNLTVAHRLFSDNLEKGVIRRGRARCVLLPRANDAELAAQFYRQLLEEAPPLTA